MHDTNPIRKPEPVAPWERTLLAEQAKRSATIAILDVYKHTEGLTAADVTDMLRKINGA